MYLFRTFANIMNTYRPTSNLGAEVFEWLYTFLKDPPPLIVHTKLPHVVIVCVCELYEGRRINKHITNNYSTPKKLKHAFTTHMKQVCLLFPPSEGSLQKALPIPFKIDLCSSLVSEGRDRLCTYICKRTFNILTARKDNWIHSLAIHY